MAVECQILDGKTNSTLVINVTGQTNFGAYKYFALDTNFAHLSQSAVVRPAGWKQSSRTISRIAS